MYRNSWELEVYANDFQASRQREAAMRRRADEAAPRGQQHGHGFNLGAARFLETVKRWVSSGSRAPAQATDRREVATTVAAPPIAVEREYPARAAGPNRLTSPYAGMVVVARTPAPKVEAVEQPCAVGDC